MKCNNVRQRIDPVLAPDQFSIARPLRPKDLDRRVTPSWYLSFATSPKWSSME